MNIKDLLPPTENKIEFHLSKLNFLPELNSCYVISNFFGEILYIGLTNNLKRRVKEHLESREKTKLTQKGKGYFLYYKIIEREIELKIHERSWLNQFELMEGKLPILNSIHSPL